MACRKEQKTPIKGQYSKIGDHFISQSVCISVYLELLKMTQLQARPTINKDRYHQDTPSLALGALMSVSSADLLSYPGYLDLDWPVLPRVFVKEQREYIKEKLCGDRYWSFCGAWEWLFVKRWFSGRIASKNIDRSIKEKKFWAGRTHDNRRNPSHIAV